MKVTSDDGKVYYDKIAKTITVPAGQRPQWRTTHVLVGSLVKSLANDDLIGLTGFSCAARGRVCLRDLRVGLASLTESATATGPRTDGRTRAASTVPLTQTPRYLVPQMEGVPVSEPAIYRSLYIVDTIDQGGPSLQIDSEKHEMWLGEAGYTMLPEEHPVFGAMERFYCYDPTSPGAIGSLRLMYMDRSAGGLPGLPKGDEVSFEHLEKPDVIFAFEIGVSTSKASVTKIRVTSDSGNNSYDPKTKTITVPVGKGTGDLRTTRVPVAFLVESLAHDALMGLGQFSCFLTSPGELRFRKL